MKFEDLKIAETLFISQQRVLCLSLRQEKDE